MNGGDFLATDSARGLALVVGIFFGFWLERAGFGSSRKLTAIFYRRDFAVLKVMFSAIVTAAVGMHVLSLTGLVPDDRVTRLETFLWPQIVGGLVFGVGFVTGGWCPGTALVGAASGKVDALAFLLGAGAGSLAFAAAWPAIGSFASAGACGVLTLPQVFGLAPTAVVAGVVALALIAFSITGRLTVRTAD